MRDLTEPQKAMLSHVIDYHADYGKAPTRAEIAEALGYNHQHAVDTVLLALEKKRYIAIRERRHRNIEILRNYQ
jgi:SOS-response transcriptional repressor LexA